MCDKCYEPASFIDPRNKPVRTVNQYQTKKINPRPYYVSGNPKREDAFADDDQYAQRYEQMDCCSGRKRKPERRRQYQWEIDRDAGYVPKREIDWEYMWVCVGSVVGVVGLFVLLVWGQMAQQSQVMECYQKNLQDVSEMC